jgi:P27 family predicted phage terminase small subunit
LPVNEPKPPLGAKMPDGMTEDARAHWPVVAKQLQAAGVLTRMDAVALMLYCEAFARWRMATDMVYKTGPTVTNERTGSIKMSPYLIITQNAHNQMLKLLVEFGMTPASRSRITAAVQPAEREGALARILNGDAEATDDDTEA